MKQPADGVARHIRRAALLADPDGLTDGDLLGRFLSERDEVAFELLVRRHGSMVLATCRRVLGNDADADDTFQAAFVVLVRKASSLLGRATVGDWLYGVAYHTALKARAAAARRRGRESAAARPAWAVVPDREQEECLRRLDQELARLPDRYREAVVLCELERRPRKEAARLLGIPEGTLSSRLATAHERLARRLRQGGLPTVALPPLSAELLGATGHAGAVAAGHLNGGLPAAVAQLSEEGVSGMFLSRLAVAVGLVLLGAAVVTAMTAGRRGGASDGAAPEPLGNGVYELKFEGAGLPVRLGDGAPAVLGKRLSESVGRGAALRSVSNDNTRFVFNVNKLGPLPARVSDMQTALVVDGVCLHLGRPEKLAADGTANTWANVESAQAARTLATHYKITPQRRTHPGHRFDVRWRPTKARYAPGEAVTLNLELRNAGGVPVRFWFGGRQRGPRDNQFRFLAYRWNGLGKAVPDTGDPTNFGGKSRPVLLKPGEVFTATVGLDKWFTFKEADTYRVTGILQLSLCDPNADGHETIWDELAVGECSVRVVRGPK